MNSNMSALTAEDLLKHAAWLQRLARRLVDPTTAEDMVQETWAAAVRTQPDRGRPLRPWLKEVLLNQVRSRARSLSRFRARVPTIVAAERPLPSPEELLSFHQAQRLVADAVSELQEPYRSTVLLCYAQDIPPIEVARRQGVPAGTVRWRLKQGLDKIRAALDARHGNDSVTWRAILAPLAARAAPGGSVAVPPMARALAGGRLGVRQVATTAGLVVAAAVVGYLFSGVEAPGSSSRGPVAAAARGPRPARGAADWSAITAAAPASAARASLNAAPETTSQEGALPAPPVHAEEAIRRAIDPADSPARGNPGAPVTLVVWSDFQCPFCARASTTMRELEAAYPEQLRVVFKHLPLPFHESAFFAAEAALAAHEQGKFWQMHDCLFARQDRMDPASIAAEARALGLDLPRLPGRARFGQAAPAGASRSADSERRPDSGHTDLLPEWRAPAGESPAGRLHGKGRGGAGAGEGSAGRPPPAASGDRGPTWEARGPLVATPPWPPTPVTLPQDQLGPTIAGRFTIGAAPTRGNPQSPVEVLYFTPLAKQQARQTLEGLLRTYGAFVRVVAKVMPYPVDSGGSPTLLAEAALFAHAQGKFWLFHDAFTQDYPRPDRELVFEVARRIGLDRDDLAAALEGRRFQPLLEEEASALDGAGIHEAAFVVQGRLASSSAALVQLVEDAIRKAGGQPPPRPMPDPGAATTNPGDGRYDSERLLATMSARQIFDLEPRDPAWAGAVEEQLAPLVARDLRAVEPAVRATGIECRTTICRLHWKNGAQEASWPGRFAHFFYSGVNVPASPDPGEHHLFLRRPGESTPDPGVARLKVRRASVIHSLRTGRPTNGLRRWPLGRLPTD